jgi:hypothetical protein
MRGARRGGWGRRRAKRWAGFQVENEFGSFGNVAESPADRKSAPAPPALRVRREAGAPARRGGGGAARYCVERQDVRALFCFVKDRGRATCIYLPFRGRATRYLEYLIGLARAHLGAAVPLYTTDFGNLAAMQRGSLPGAPLPPY